ncbi:MAG: RnfABCDGE type electron transport complex subunit D [Mizugakiibacter sp.]|uniref:RnfABCDGE type electron transport complex subunit D n=1 Tax=Mizugakiibacter sp. TaxID=1972610 RepID=UPI0031CA1380|nr:RnfABCDGE type electron transport complex subunit D [Xanthomonadaceae bacterium]
MRRFPTAGAPHLPPPTRVRGVMATVLLALLPGIAAHAWYFGPGIVVQIALATAFALGFEAMMLRVRGVPAAPFLGDLSAPVTAVLYALCIPPLTPWWITLLAMATAIVLAKHLYGGLGRNLFNPAMAGYATALVCFPHALSQWLAPAPLATHALAFGDTLSAIFLGHLPPGLDLDTLAQATPLDAVRTLARQGMTMPEIRANPMFGDFGGKGWEWIANAYALGGLALWWRRVIGWQVPVAVLGTTILLTLPFWLADPDLHPFPLQHVFSGGLMLGAWFVATDPVTGCTTPRGRLLFGAGVAVLTLAIRRWGAYPDGVAFAVLIMNGAAPLIDRLTPPRAYGHGHA